MKHTLILILLSIGTLRADIVLNDNGTVTKDGVSLNLLPDAVLNRQITSAEATAAIQAKLDAANAALASAQANLAGLQQQLTSKLETSLSQLQAALNAATNDTQRAVLAGQIALVQSFQIAAGKSPDQLALEAAQAAADKAAADLAALIAKQASN